MLKTVQRLQARSWKQSTEACCGMTVDTSVTVNYFSHESASLFFRHATLIHESSKTCSSSLSALAHWSQKGPHWPHWTNPPRSGLKVSRYFQPLEMNGLKEDHSKRKDVWTDPRDLFLKSSTKRNGLGLNKNPDFFLVGKWGWPKAALCGRNRTPGTSHAQESRATHAGYKTWIWGAGRQNGRNSEERVGSW